LDLNAAGWCCGVKSPTLCVPQRMGHPHVKG
jgi:hypothetical protein